MAAKNKTRKTKCPTGKHRHGKTCRNTKGKCPKGSQRSKSGKKCMKN